MSIETHDKVIAVFDSCYQKAPRMTHALCELGNGDMGRGIVTLWRSGRDIGFIQGTAVTTLVFILGIGTHKIVAAIREDRRIKKILREANYEIHMNNQAIEGGCNCA